MAMVPVWLSPSSKRSLALCGLLCRFLLTCVSLVLHRFRLTRLEVLPPVIRVESYVVSVASRYRSTSKWDSPTVRLL